MGEKNYSSFFAPSLREARKRTIQEIEHLTFTLDPAFRSLGVGKTYMIKTYGCQGNLSDSEKISGLMEAMGYREVDSEDKADVLFFNTCAIRDNAEKRVFGELGRLKGLKKQNKDMLVCVCGCMSQEEEVVNKKTTTKKATTKKIGAENKIKASKSTLILTNLNFANPDFYARKIIYSIKYISKKMQNINAQILPLQFIFKTLKIYGTMKP